MTNAQIVHRARVLIAFGVCGLVAAVTLGTIAALAGRPLFAAIDFACGCLSALFTAINIRILRRFS